MTDLDDSPVEPESPYGLPQRPFHVQAVEQTGSYTPMGQQASAAPQQRSYSPQQESSSPQYPRPGGVQHAMPAAKSPVAALVCGILAWLGFHWFTAIPAIILGVKGRRAAREGRTPNGGMATAGLWLGIVDLVVAPLVLAVLLAIVVPVFLNQRHKGIDEVLVGDMKKMATLQNAYVNANPGKKGFGVAATSPGGTVTAPGVAFTSSPGNVIAVVVGPSGFCLSGYNAGASVAISPTASKVYLSGSKDLEAGVGTC